MLRKTTVSVAKSQEDITKVLRLLGARGVQFTDNFDEDRINIRFPKELRRVDFAGSRNGLEVRCGV